MTDLEAIRAKYDLRPMVEAAGVTLRRVGDKMQGLCPFHQEDTPSFYVWRDSYYCFGCQTGGDLFSWVQHSENCTFTEAVQRLGGETFKQKYVKFERKPGHDEPRIVKTLSLDDARKTRSRLYGLTIPYFVDRRHLALSQVDKHLLGSVTWDAHVDYNEHTFRLPYLRHAIPHIYGETVYNIRFRQDGESALEAWKLFHDKNPHMWQMRSDKLCAHFNVVEGSPEYYKRVLDTVFGGRFRGVEHCQNKVFNAGRALMQTPKGNVARTLPHLIISAENKEIDIMSLESAGFYAIGRMASAPMAAMTSKTTLKVVVQDNDGNPASEKKAINTAKEVGTDYIFIPPNPYKDINDMVVAGIDLAPYFKKYDIEPVEVA